jgi:hypothetical protein
VVSNLIVYYQNTRGLRTKCTEFRQNLSLNYYDIVVISETWLQDSFFDGELCNGGYDVFRRDRDLDTCGKSTGGGVMILVKSSLEAWRGAAHEPRAPVEMLTVSVPARALASSADLHISAVYIPPDVARISRDIDSILNAINSAFNCKPLDNYLILGDFNLPNIHWNSSNPIFSSRGPTVIQEASLKLVYDLTLLDISQYNQLCNYAGNTLDLAFSNLPLNIEKSVPVVREDPAHPPFSVEILDLTAKPLREASNARYNYRKADYEYLNKHFANANWAELLRIGSVNELTGTFYNLVNEAIKNYVPLVRQRDPNRSYPIWFSSSLIKLIKEKSKAHSKWK